MLGGTGSLSGPQATWQMLTGTVTTGAQTAYAVLVLLAQDAVAGASAGGTIWWDNAQVWNVTATGQASMPYCALRFASSLAELVVSGLLGDLPAPAALALGTYLANWAGSPNGSTLSFALGRTGGPLVPSGVGASLVGASVAYAYAGVNPAQVVVLDSSSYGGYAVQTALGSGGWNPRAFSPTAAQVSGVYHLWTRFQTQQAAGNLGNVQVRVQTQQRTQPWWGLANVTDSLGAYYGPYSAPLVASNTWTVVDAGQVALPPWGQGALTDPSQTYLTPRPQWIDTTSGGNPQGATASSGWQLLLPVDGSLLVGVANNPTNGPVTVSGQWLWLYADGLLVNRAGVGDGPALTYSVEGVALPNAAHGGGGPGTATTGTINVNAAADPYLTLDPSQASLVNGATNAGVNAGVNVLAGVLADGVGTVLPLCAEVQYSPLYLYPR